MSFVIDAPIEAALKNVGITAAYRYFRRTDQTDLPAPPFIHWYIGQEDFSGDDDDCCRTVKKTVYLRLTTTEKSPELEKAIERNFRGICDSMSKTEDYNDSDEVFEVVYTLTITEKMKY